MITAKPASASRRPSSSQSLIEWLIGLDTCRAEDGNGGTDIGERIEAVNKLTHDPQGAPRILLRKLRQRRLAGTGFRGVALSSKSSSSVACPERAAQFKEGLATPPSIGAVAAGSAQRAFFLRFMGKPWLGAPGAAYSSWSACSS